MRKLVSICSVSVIAVMAVVSARAEVVATTRLDTRLGTTGNLATVASTGSYADLTNKPTIPAAANNATLTIQKNGTTAGTFTANASANKTINITVPTKVSELTNDSSFATTTAVNAKVSIAQGTANAGKGLVVDGTSGNLTLTDVATQAELNTVSGKIPTNTNQLTNGAGFITSAAISGKEDSSNKVTAISSTSSDTQYPSAKAVYTELAKKQNNLTIDTALSADSTNPVQNKVVNTALSAKEAAANKTNTYNANATSTEKATKFPTVSAAEAIAAAKVNAAAGNYATAAQGKKADTALQYSVYDSDIGKVTATEMGTTASTVVTAIKEIADRTLELKNAADKAHDAADEAAAVARDAQTTANKAVVANAAITAGTGTKITYDAKGLVTGSTALAASDIPTLSISKISGLQGSLNNKQATLTTSNIKGAGSVSVGISNGVITIAGTDTDTIPTLDIIDDGNIVTDIAPGAKDGILTVTKGRVMIPWGAPDAKDYVPIWVE